MDNESESSSVSTEVNKKQRTLFSCSMSNHSHHAKLGKYAASLWKEKSMTDVVVFVQSQEFKVHKAVLACYSPYFKEVLEKPGSSDCIFLQLPSVTAKAFEILIEYMYTGKINVTCQDLSEVYRAARRLGMQGALKQCIEHLHVTPSKFKNMVYLYVTARKLNLLDSSIRAFHLMTTHFEKLIETKEYLHLEKEQMVELLSADEIGTRSEVILYLAALKWIDYKYIEREENLVDILGCIRFPLMTLREIMACYHPPILPGIVKFSEVREFLLKATCYIAAQSMKQEYLFEELAARPRKFLYKEETVLLWDLSLFNKDQYEKRKQDKAATKIQATVRGFLTRKQYYKCLARANIAAAVIQSRYRGYKARKNLPVSKTKKYEIMSIKLKPENNIQKSEFITNDKEYSRKAEYGNHLKQSNSKRFFLMGVSETTDPRNGKLTEITLYSFSPEVNKWKFISRCPVQLYGTKIASTAEAIYVVGGCSLSEHMSKTSVEPLMECHKYQFAEEKWTKLPSMNRARSMYGAVIFQNNILVVGGKDECEEFRILKSIVVLNEKLNEWSQFDPSLPIPLAAMGVAVQDSNLWIAGGLTQIDHKLVLSDAVWCFSGLNKKWQKHCSLPQPVAFISLLVVSDRILSIGGIVRSEVDGELESTNYVYLLECRKWIEKKPMPEVFHNVIACVSGENIYVFGGQTTKTMTTLRNPFYFDSKKNEWLTLTQLPNHCQFILASTTCTEAE